MVAFNYRAQFCKTGSYAKSSLYILFFLFLTSAGVVTAQDNTSLGVGALPGSTGHYNTAVGNNALFSNTAVGANNIALGTNALKSNTEGITNIAIGNDAMFSNITSGYNIAIGRFSLYANNGGENNIAIGYKSLTANVFGNANTAVGHGVMGSHRTGHSNSAFGYTALSKDSSGIYNSAFGTNSLGNNKTGSYNSAISNALINNISGSNNNAMGFNALQFNTIGNYNVAMGENGLSANISGSSNCAYGRYAIGNNITGGNNIGIGEFSLYSNIDGANNIGIGEQSLQGNASGSGNIGIGRYTGVIPAGSVFTNAIAIGYNAKVGSSNSMVLGNNTVNVGIGLSIPSAKLHAVGISAASTDYTIKAENSASASLFTVRNDGQIKAGNNAFLIAPNGNVGIGTDLTSNTAGYKLAVNGGIRAKDLVVETGWSDFVFEENFKRMTLLEKEAFYKKEKHLPNIVSEKEIQENGLNVGATMSGMTQNIEENTMELVEVYKKIIELEKENMKLKERLLSLENAKK